MGEPDSAPIDGGHARRDRGIQRADDPGIRAPQRLERRIDRRRGEQERRPGSAGGSAATRVSISDTERLRDRQALTGRELRVGRGSARAISRA